MDLMEICVEVKQLNNNKVSVVIPAKNESCSIYDLVTQILDIGYLEVIVVNESVKSIGNLRDFLIEAKTIGVCWFG